MIYIVKGYGGSREKLITGESDLIGLCLKVIKEESVKENYIKIKLIGIFASVF